ncbi:MAG: two component transcriptional regulator, LuxR family protein [Acidimicrobiaceae bacterium]|nr:two component transcriptional regulator, LuxR family protein [Acidimicrobiaceae bacterium]
MRPAGARDGLGAARVSRAPVPPNNRQPQDRATLTGRNITVTVVDDHAMVAEGLSALLDEHDDLEVVGTAGGVADAYCLIEERQPDVVVIDYRLPDGDGASATVEIVRRWPGTKVVMLSAEGGDELLALAIRAGCFGFLPKERAGAELATAVRAAQRGEFFVPTDVLAGLLERLRPAPDSGAVTSQLTNRELQVLKLVAEGRSTDAIRTELGLSEHTVRNHVRAILAKLGAHSKLEAVAIAAREGIVSLGGDDRHR